MRPGVSDLGALNAGEAKSYGETSRIQDASNKTPSDTLGTAGFAASPTEKCPSEPIGNSLQEEQTGP